MWVAGERGRQFAPWLATYSCDPDRYKSLPLEEPWLCPARRLVSFESRLSPQQHRDLTDNQQYTTTTTTTLHDNWKRSGRS